MDDNWPAFPGRCPGLEEPGPFGAESAWTMQRKLESPQPQTIPSVGEIMTAQPRTPDCHDSVGTLVIRADADSQIGTGHVMRCVALAQAWRAAGGRAILLSSPGESPQPETGDSPFLQRVVASGLEYQPLSHRHPHPGDFDATLGFLESISERATHTWLAVDGYHFDAAYVEAVRDCGSRVLLIDDGQFGVSSLSSSNASHLPSATAAGCANLLLNQNLGAENVDYACDEETTLLLGSRYLLLRPEFLDATPGGRSIPDVARKVLVTMGGADPHNDTALAIRALEQVNSDLPGGVEARIVLGGSFQRRHVELLQRQLARSSAGFQPLANVEDMPGLMNWADVALSAAGTTAWELAFLGVPATLLVVAENQRPVAERLAEAGAAVNLGCARRLTADRIAAEIVALCRDAGRRRRQCEAGRRLIDGRGAARVVAVMKALDDPELESLRLRPAALEDARPLWRLAGDPTVRRSSLSTGPIGWEEHAEWLDRLMKNVATGRAGIWVLDLEGVVLGSIRYEHDDQERIEVSLSVAAPFRRRGLAARLLEETWRRACEAMGARQVRAVVRRENAASRRAFARAGFTGLGPAEVRGCACEIFEKSLTPHTRID